MTRGKRSVLGRRILWKGRFLQSMLVTYRNSRGEVIPWEAFDRVDVKGIAVIVPFTRDDTVIIVKQFRPPVNRYVIEFPAGLNDRDESLEEVAQRELLEETGCMAGELEVIARGPHSAGASMEILTVFLATDVQCGGCQMLDHAEDIEVMEVPENDFYDHVLALQNERTYLDLKLFGLFEIGRREFRARKRTRS